MDISIHTATLPLRKPFRTGSWSIASRQIIIVHVHDKETGYVGYGEAAPLPAFGTESFEDVLQALGMFADRNGIESADSMKKMRDALSGIPVSSLPCAAFAVETAFLDVEAKRRRMPLSAMLAGGKSAPSVPVNAVVGAVGSEETAIQALGAIKAGFSCIKLKVGALPLDEDIRRVSAARDAVGPDISLRLDANCAWDRETALKALTRLAPLDIEYIEQPVCADDLEGLEQLSARKLIPVAADESIQNLRLARELLERDAVDVFVVKPMAAGSLLASREFALDVISRGKKIVFTSLVDSSLGRHAVAHLCASLFMKIPQGLGTGALFALDVADDDIRGGRFHLPPKAGVGVVPSIPSELV